MPIVKPSYRTFFPFTNPDVQTVFPKRFRRVRGVRYVRERLELPDGDFMDLDWSAAGKRRVAILLHGMEGHSRRFYILGMVRALNRRGWDTVSVNFRGCSGGPNRLLRSYHHGVSDDLHAVVRHVLATRSADSLAAVGFSLGGNVLMKYLGEGTFPVPEKFRCGVGISVPCDLEGCAGRLAEKRNVFYQRYFFRLLREKVRAKMALFPGQIDDRAYDTIRDFREHDDLYTAPLHGFRDALDYWRTAACGRYLRGVTVPALIVNAADDPFLSKKSFPRAEAAKSPNLFLEVPRHGGHCGFVSFGRGGEYWDERRTAAFLEEHG
jgi:hypothetical protein